MPKMLSTNISYLILASASSTPAPTTPSVAPPTSNPNIILSIFTISKFKCTFWLSITSFLNFYVFIAKATGLQPPCDGKKCGDSCLSGDLIGTCNADEECDYVDVFITSVDCGNFT